jgi:hypothetical protein
MAGPPGWTPCVVCGGAVSTDEATACYQISIPRGLSPEVKLEALRRARAVERLAPSRGEERTRYDILAFLRNGTACGSLSEEERVVYGRALDSVGGRLVAAHGGCAGRNFYFLEQDLEYETDGWSAA